MEGLILKALIFAQLICILHAKMVAPLEKAEGVSCPADDAGIAAAAVISDSDARFASFVEASDNLEKWMNLSINPCDDFYGYTCKKGQVDQIPGEFGASDTRNVQIKIDAYKDEAYFVNAPKPLKQLKHFFDKCVNTDATVAAVAASLKSKFETLKKEIGVNFPMAYQSESVTDLTADDLANLLGFPLNDLGVGSLVSISVGYDWKEPDDIKDRIFVDQLIPMYYSYVYSNWTYYKPVVVDEIVSITNILAKVLGTPLDQTRLKSDASDVVEFEYALQDYVTDRDTRRQAERSYNLLSIEDLQKSSNAYNWISLLKTALARANAPEKITNDRQVMIMEPEQISKLSTALLAKKFDATTIANYVYYRALTGLQDNLPPVKDLPSENDFLAKKLRRSSGRVFRNQPTLEELSKIGKQLNLAPTSIELQCQQKVSDTMNRAVDRIFVDKVYPTPESRAEIRTQVRDVADWIFSGFRTQIDKLTWMSAESKQGAYKKIENIVLNIAYSDWVTDDAKLSEYYAGLTIEDSFTTIQTTDAIVDFVLTQAVENFRVNKPRDRGDFGHYSVSVTNAEYKGNMNSISLFAGILHPPFYHPQYPAAVNFGGLGTVSGHELTHGFDDEGVQFDDIGYLDAWMDEASNAEFTKMANCVVEEYDGFCPIDGLCLDGANTQGENIADNGGMQAAYNAFKAYEAYFGPDPRLPGFGSKFSNDQLFFLSFGNVWCDAPYTEQQYRDKIERNEHSPELYRVFGTIQNFPAFRTAFNCPLGSAYAPKDHCDVWTSPPA